MRTRVAVIAAAALAIGAIVAARLHAASAPIGWLAALACLSAALSAAAALKDAKLPSDRNEPQQERGPEALPSSIDTISRNQFARFFGLAIGAIAVLAVVPFAAYLRRYPRGATAWTAGARLVTPQGEELRADSLLVGSIATVFPAGRIGAPDSATLLLRLPEGVLRGEAGRAAWSPAGNVAYSKICTHAGCPVAVYRRASYQLYCPCHQSLFDVLDSAQPLAGPATRALPQLALDVDAEGYLIARGGFSGPVGPDDWSRTL